MAKNILVITGSPRKSGNSDLLADAFIKGALSKGHRVTKFAAAAKAISGCKACDTCWSTGHACSFQDGFTELEPLLAEADVIVFASPLYWFALSAQIKAAMDRMYAYDRENRSISVKIKEAVLLVCGAGESMDIFAGVIASHKCALEYLNWQNAGILAVPNVSAKGDILKTAALQQAEQLGKAL